MTDERKYPVPLTNSHYRLLVVHTEDTVHVYSQFMVHPPEWHTDQDSGICIERRHLPALLAALKESTER